MGKKVVIRLITETTCKLNGVESFDCEFLYKKFRARPENYAFNPKFKLGVWDGYVSFCGLEGTTYVYLLPQILPHLISQGYEIEIVDKREGRQFNPPLITEDYFKGQLLDDGTPLLLRDYQYNIVNACIQAGNGIAIAATGAGKSITCAAIARSYATVGARVIVITPSDDLVSQTRSDFLQIGVNCGIYSGTLKDYLNHDIVISTWQSLQHNPTLMQTFQCVIVDESHGVRGPVLSELLNLYGKNIVHRFGVTGTLPTNACEQRTLEVALGSILYTVTAAELIKAGVLASLQIHIKQLEEDLTTQYQDYLEDCAVVNKPPSTYNIFKSTYFPDWSSEKAYNERNSDRTQWIADTCSELRQQGNTFMLVSSISVGKKLQKAIPDSVFLHGSDKKKIRQEIYKQFKDNDNLMVIATVNIASTGLNIKRIYNLVLLDVGKSFVRVIQSIGRGLRKAHDKDHVDVYDICNDFKYAKLHLSKRTGYYRRSEYPYNKKIIKYKDLNKLC